MVDEYYLLKICLLGSEELKNKMIEAFIEGKYSAAIKATIGVELITKQIEVQDDIVKIVIVDANREFFGKLRPSYYRGTSACLIAFDKDNRKSFKQVKGWLKEFRRHIPDLNVPIGLVGMITKDEEVTTGEGKILADELGMSYYERTVNDNSGSIEEIFRDLTIKALKVK